jgi:hypothetical protein
MRPNVVSRMRALSTARLLRHHMTLAPATQLLSRTARRVWLPPARLLATQQQKPSASTSSMHVAAVKVFHVAIEPDASKAATAKPLGSSLASHSSPPRFVLLRPLLLIAGIFSHLRNI